MADVIAASENGCAGQVCRPCPNAVTSIGDGSALWSASRYLFQRAGSQCFRSGATEVLSSGSRVAMIHPAGTR